MLTGLHRLALLRGGIDAALEQLLGMAPGPGGSDGLLLETGGYLLLEDGNYLLMVDSDGLLLETGGYLLLEDGNYLLMN